MGHPSNGGKDRRRFSGFNEADAWLDSKMFAAGRAVRDWYTSFSDWADRFAVTGPQRVLVELASEGFSLGVLGFLLMLALAIPAFRETRSDWKSQTEYSVTFLDRFGNEIGQRGILQNEAVPLSEIPDHVIKATLATEDRRFYYHFGIDVLGTFRAVAANAQAQGVVQGGSSITQQLAKNLFLSNERTLERKIKEAFLALWLESRMTKDEILKLYLDRAYMGGGTFGIEAAARFYFGKSVRDVTLAEAAMLAGLFKAPTKYAPHVNLPAARARASTVLDNLVEAGFKTEGQVYAARRHPAEATNHSDSDTPNYFLDWVFDQIKAMDLHKERVLTVRTTLDPNLQKLADLSVETSLRQHGSEYGVKQAAMVVMEPDGAVRAMVGGRDYGASQFNRATHALRQPGSSFKPYVYATALMHGYTPKTIVRDAPISIGNWSPQNYTRTYRGDISLTTALTHSINTIPVRLAQAIGRDKIVDIAYRMGVRTELKITRSLPLGSSEVTVLDQAAGYSVFANGGRAAKPTGILEIRNSQGDTIYHRSPSEAVGEQVLSPKVVADMNFMLNKATEEGTGRRALLPGIKIAGKTGTTNGYRDAWFIGYSGNYVGAVWFGNDDIRPMKRMTGGSVPAMTWHKVMAYAHTGIDVKPLPGVAPFEGAPPAPPPVADAAKKQPDPVAELLPKQ
ncbi:MAG: penicillin-binding protein 1A, partial [Pseudomonadota bacterium]|nr:penicillin-binding protein 1A [Pseudomonadota bacterium]